MLMGAVRETAIHQHAAADRNQPGNHIPKDLPKDLAEFMARSQMPVAVAAFTAKVPVAAWHDKPSCGVVAKMI